MSTTTVANNDAEGTVDSIGGSSASSNVLYSATRKSSKIIKSAVFSPFRLIQERSCRSFIVTPLESYDEIQDEPYQSDEEFELELADLVDMKMNHNSPRDVFAVQHQNSHNNNNKSCSTLTTVGETEHTSFHDESLPCLEWSLSSLPAAMNAFSTTKYSITDDDTTILSAQSSPHFHGIQPESFQTLPLLFRQPPPRQLDTIWMPSSRENPAKRPHLELNFFGLAGVPSGPPAQRRSSTSSLPLNNKKIRRRTRRRRNSCVESRGRKISTTSVDTHQRACTETYSYKS